MKQKIYDFIVNYIKEHGYSPSFQEIGDGVNLKSKSGVHWHLHKMFEAGILETDAEDSSPRAIRVPGMKFYREKEIDILLDLLVDFTSEQICEELSLCDDYCESHCKYAAPQKECLMEYARRKSDEKNV